MTSKSSLHIVVVIIGYLGLFFPIHTYAAQVSFSLMPNEVVGDTATIVEVRLDTEGRDVNAIEGIVRLENAGTAVVSSAVVETGGSVLTLWPVAPTYSAVDGIIRFTGGIPEGFTREGLIFRIRIFASKPGTVSLSWIGGSAYLGDGKGTTESISSRSITISLSPSTPNPINPASIDSKPPYFDMVEVGRDAEAFDGKYFVSFHATDDLSGLDRYEVTEDQVVTKVENGVYVLHDQEKKARVILTAYDKAGNSKSIKVPAEYDRDMYLAVAVVIFIACIMFFIRRKFYAVIVRSFKK